MESRTLSSHRVSPAAAVRRERPRRASHAVRAVVRVRDAQVGGGGCGCHALLAPARNGWTSEGRGRRRLPSAAVAGRRRERRRGGWRWGQRPPAAVGEQWVRGSASAPCCRWRVEPARSIQGGGARGDAERAPACARGRRVGSRVAAMTHCARWRARRDADAGLGGCGRVWRRERWRLRVKLDDEVRVDVRRVSACAGRWRRGAVDVRHAERAPSPLRECHHDEHAHPHPTRKQHAANHRGHHNDPRRDSSMYCGSSRRQKERGILR